MAKSLRGAARRVLNERSLGPARSHGRPDCLTVHSQGGLGNQLFIYAAGLAAAQVAGTTLRVDSSLHREDPNRPFVLPDLGLPADYVDLGAESSSVPPRGCDVRESGFPFEASVLSSRPGQCLFGYFQSWRYVLPVREVLQESFRALERDRSERPVFAQARAAVQQPGAIVLHVRRGDYLTSQSLAFHGLTGMAYYESAVHVLRRMGFDGPLLVFSDDVAAARDELAGLGEVIAPDLTGLDATDEMLLMSHAPSLVTANSSFSWWAGWIGDAPERPVISPRPWFDDTASDTRDLLPPRWLTLQR